MDNNYRKIENRTNNIRTVPGFTLQALQSNTRVPNPPKTGIFQQHPVAPSRFRFYYERRDLPVGMDYSTHQPRIKWLVNIKYIDHEWYLPIFFLGLSEITHPYQTLVNQGISEILDIADNNIVRCLPNIAQSIKRALRLNNPKVIINVCKAIKKLTTHSRLLATALVNYYPDILPVLRTFKEKNVNLGDHIEYGQHKGNNVGDLINNTLEMLETTAGKGAYQEIKYIVPTYTSVIHN